MPEESEIQQEHKENPLTKIPMELVPEEWKDHVRDLRRENQSLRERNGKADDERQKAIDAALAKARAEHDETIGKERTAAQDRVLRAELKAAALKAGMVDLDGLKLADLSKVKINEQGEVEGAESLMESMKEAKPYLFQTANSTSSTTGVPPKGEAKAKLATEMSAEEYAAYKAKALKG